MTTADDGLLRDVRVIRRVAGPPESPWAGSLAVLSSGDSCLLVEADLLGDGWPGWSSSGDGHVLGPLDVLRTATGHLAALPACRETLDDVIARRESSGAALTDGERLTIAVSLLRGCGALDPAAVGEWWMTDDARPVFAALTHGETATSSASRILTGLGSGAGRLGDVVSDAARLVLEHDRPARESDALEERLFQLADPEPVALTAFAPRHARSLSALREPDPETATEEQRGLWSTLVRHVDADLADAVSQATTGVWRRFRRPRASGRRRGGPWVAAAAVSAAIIGGAALVPSAADEPTPVVTSFGETSPPATPSTAVASAAPEDHAAEPAPVESDAPIEDLAVIVGELLDRRVACAGEADCLAATMADASASLPSGAIDLPAGERSVALIDDLGGLAVLRVSPVGGGADQFAVVVLTDGKWLLRDVHDVAEQP